MRDQRLDKRLEAEGVALWCTDQSSGVSDGHRVFVLHAVKLETKDVSQLERCIRALWQNIRERRSYVLCSAVHESGLRELVSQSVIGVLLTHNVHGANQR